MCLHLLNPVRISRSAQEFCLVEPSGNSVRVSLAVRKADALAALIVRKYADFMGQRASQFRLLRRVPVAQAYDVSFLVSAREVEALGCDRIIDFILLFLSSIDADVAAMRMMVSERSRAVAAEVLGSMATSAASD